MTIAELGSVGELIAAIATLATLVYLAIQIRQNTTTARTATYQAIVSTSIELGNTFARDASFADVFARGVGDPDALEGADYIRLSAHIGGVLRCYELVFHQFQLGAVDAAVWHGWRANMQRFVAMPAYARVWNSSKHEFPPAFVAEVEQAISEESMR